MDTKHIVILVATLSVLGVGTILASEGYFHHKVEPGVKSVEFNDQDKSICTLKVEMRDVTIVEFPELGVTCFRSQFKSRHSGGVGMSCVDGLRLSENIGYKIDIPEPYCGK